MIYAPTFKKDYFMKLLTLDIRKDIFMTILLFSMCGMCFTQDYEMVEDGIVRGAKDKKELALILTGGSFAEGGDFILDTLKKYNVKASFFFTGDFFRIEEFKPIIKRIIKEGHYIGPHSDKHLLLADWEHRKNLVTEEVFKKDLEDNLKELEKFGVKKKDVTFWIPPYEWYTKEHSQWSKEMGITLFNFTPGTRSNTDYMEDDDPKYVPADKILESIIKYEQENKDGLNGFLLLMHIGAGPGRTKDKFFYKLPDLLDYLSKKGYKLVKVDELLKKK